MWSTIELGQHIACQPSSTPEGLLAQDLEIPLGLTVPIAMMRRPSLWLTWAAPSAISFQIRAKSLISGHPLGPVNRKSRATLKYPWRLPLP